MENLKIKHLEMIQGIVSRLAKNSFLIKGWSVTITSAIFALGAKGDNESYFAIAIIPVVIFWILDGYFLWQERLFRRLYDEVRTMNDAEIDFSMNIEPFTGGETWVCAIMSTTLLTFHLSLLAAAALIMAAVTA